ncbi:MAG: hypothetical protein Q9187_005652 [Circinaria calcarea]
MGSQPAGNKDYLDKGKSHRNPRSRTWPLTVSPSPSAALDFIEKKFGGARFRDPNNPQNRAMNEKITDGIRKIVEKLTGYTSYLRYYASF